MPLAIITAITILGMVGGGAYMTYMGSQARVGQAAQLAAQAELNRQQAYASQVQSQISIERLTPLLWAFVPLMALAGAFFLWKSGQRGDRE